MPVSAKWAVMFATLLTAQENVIRIDTRLVQVNVLVHEKDGTPVEGLTKDDFTLTDGGKPRPISFFSVDRVDSARSAPPNLPPNTFGNHPSLQASRSPSITIVLLDGTNTRLTDQSYAHRQLAKLLSQLNPADKVALYALGSSLRVLQDFTSDSGQLLRFLETYRGTSSSELAGEAMKAPTTGIAVIDAIVAAMDAGSADQIQNMRTRRTYEALADIANRVAQFPGRKNLVWLSSAFPLTMGFEDPSKDEHGYRDPRRIVDSFVEERERATRAMTQANIAIYPVDARGLAGAPPSMTADVSSSGRTRTSLPSAVVKEAPGIDTMDALASATGGRAFHDTNDLANAVRAAVSDSAVTYTLGFYPDPARLDSKFHQLNVKVKNKGVKVRHRKGYVAYPDSPPAPGQREAAVQMALRSPLPSTGITLLGRAERVNNPEPNQVQLAVVADAHQIRINSGTDRWTGKIDVTFAQTDQEGVLLDTKRDGVNLNLDEPTYAEIMSGGILLTRTLKPMGTATQIRVVVYDQLTGATGSLIIPLSSIK